MPFSAQAGPSDVGQVMVAGGHDEQSITGTSEVHHTCWHESGSSPMSHSPTHSGKRQQVNHDNEDHESKPWRKRKNKGKKGRSPNEGKGVHHTSNRDEKKVVYHQQEIRKDVQGEQKVMGERQLFSQRYTISDGRAGKKDTGELKWIQKKLLNSCYKILT